MASKKVANRGSHKAPIVAHLIGAVAIASALTLAPVAIASAGVIVLPGTYHAYPNGTNVASTTCPLVAPSAPASAKCALSTALGDVLSGQTATIYLEGVGPTAVFSTSVAQGLKLNANNASVTISPDPSLTGNAVIDGGGSTGTRYSILALLGSNENVKISNVTFQNGDGVNFNGGDCSFVEKCAGGIVEDSAGGTLTVKNCSFIHDSSNWIGGAIDSGNDSNTSNVIVVHSLFANNSAVASGGAISAGDNGGSGNLTVIGSTFIHNTASADGGAIDAGVFSGTATLNVSNSTFIANVGGQGGAIASGDNGGTARVTIAESVFDSNSAAGDGGAMLLADHGGTVLSASLIDLALFNNTAGGINNKGLAYDVNGGTGPVVIVGLTNIVPKGTIVSSTATISSGHIGVVVSCAVATCAGSAQLTMLNAAKKAVVVATGSITLLPGAQGVVTLTENAAGKVMLAKVTPLHPAVVSAFWHVNLGPVAAKSLTLR